MSSKGKGKAVAFSGGGGKSKGGGSGGNNNDGGGGKKKRNREVLQFFEDAAEVDDNDSEDSDDVDFSEDDFMDEGEGVSVKDQPAKPVGLPFVKEEEMDEEEYDKMMEERFKTNPVLRAFVDETKEAMERDSCLPSAKDPTLWKVKCMVGRERHSAFCLMQKYVDLRSLGNKLEIISAFAVNHVKGFIFVEAYKQCDLNEACKGLSSIYASRLATIPLNERCHLFTVRNNCSPVTTGMWARLKNGKYKGDLAQIVAVNEKQRKATVKLVPRIDLQAMAMKFGGGVAPRNATVPAPRLISQSELEEFRPLIQYRRDRDTGEVCEVLDGLLLKNGYLFKKVRIDSMSCHGVMPKEEELLKFTTSENSVSDNLEWLTQLYGEPKKKRLARNEKGGDKGESSSVSGMQNRFELYSLVCIGRKDFGLIVGMEKDDYFKILKEGAAGPDVLTVDRKELKDGPSDMKFTALDYHKKTVSINDTVKVLEGPLKDKEGLVKQIYRGVIFIYDENETENGGYFCSKAHLCEKIKVPFGASYEKGSNSGSMDFDVIPSSPKSPLSPKQTWEMRENKREFKQGGKDGRFTVGQTLRIRVGPLKGYLCSVLAVRYSDVIVKLGSQQKTLTVKPEHLAEVRGKSSAVSVSDDPGSSSFKPFDLLGGEGGSGDWAAGAGTSTACNGWNAGGLSTESAAWPSFPATGLTLQSEPNSGIPSGFSDGDLQKGDASWEKKSTPGVNSSWGKAADAEGASAAGGWASQSAGQPSSWGTSELSQEKSSWNTEADGLQKGTENSSWDKKVTPGVNSSWGNAAVAEGTSAAGGWTQAQSAGQPSSWGTSELSQEKPSWNTKADGLQKGTEDASWDKKVTPGVNSSWGNAVVAKGTSVQEDSWGAAAGKWGSSDASDANKAVWKSSSAAAEKPNEVLDSAAVGWAQPQVERQPSSWGNSELSQKKSSWNANAGDLQKGTEDASWEKKVTQGVNSSWGKAGVAEGTSVAQEDSWGAAAAKWGSNDASGANKSEWKSSSATAEKPSEVLDSAAGGWTQPQSEQRPSSWGTSELSQEKSTWNAKVGSSKGWGETASGKGGSNDADAGSSWSRQDGAQEPSNWGTSKTSQENSGWNVSKAVGGSPANKWGDNACGKGGSDGADGNTISSWEKKGGWNSGTSEANQDSSWAKKSNWGSSSGDRNQDSDWGKKSSWSSGYDNLNRDSSTEDQRETFSNRGGRGSWRGGFRGRGFEDRNGSDRGVYGGRGRSDRGGFRGRGDSDRGGYRGRGRSDGGGFGGRGRGRRDPSGDWNDNNDSGDNRTSDWRNGANNSGGWKSDGGWANNSGGYGGRGGYDGGFGGRGSGRGRGRRDQSGAWNDNNDSGENKTFDWRDGANSSGGWKSDGGWGSNNSGSDRGGFGGRGRGRRDQSGGWNSNNDYGKSKMSDWGNGENNNSGWKSGGGGSSWKNGGGNSGGGGSSWNNGGGKSDGGGSSWNNGGGRSDAGGSSWNQAGRDEGQQSSWNSGSGKVEFGWNKGPNSGVAGTTEGETKTWDRSPVAGESRSSGAGQSGKVEGTYTGSAPSDSWGKASGSSWGNNGDGGSSGGWGSGNQEKALNQSTAAAGGQSSGWSQKGGADGNQEKAWNPSTAADGGQSSGWSQKGGADVNQEKPWNQSSDAAGGQTSGWSQKGGAETSGEQTDKWQKTSGSSWGDKGNDGSSKGGW